MDLDGFLEFRQEILDSILCQNTNVPKINDLFTEAFNYNLTGGKMNRANAVITAVNLLSEKPKEEMFRKVYALGWALEMIHASYLIADDIQDHSQLRRGKPCWYLKNELGMKAILNTSQLESAAFLIINKYLQDEQFYLDIFKLFSKMHFQTGMGQSLDILSSVTTKKDLVKCSLECYMDIAKYKTAYYSFSTPFRAALYLCDISTPAIHKEVETILLNMGILFQIQDDFLDCFGNPEVTGKIGTDIQDGKCTWLLATALTLADTNQKELLEKHYGSSDEESVNMVKDLFSKLKVAEKYHQVEEDMYEDILKKIRLIKEKNIKQCLTLFLKKIIKRLK